MKTQYILTLRDGTVLSKITDRPDALYWNRGEQKMDDSINPVSLFYMFEDAKRHDTIDDAEAEAWVEKVSSVHLTEFSNVTSLTEMKSFISKKAVREADKLEKM